MTIRDWKQFTPFFFYTTVALCLTVAARLSETRSISSIVPLLVGGFVSWGLIEYGLHRFIFHYDAQSERSRRFVYVMHLSHHDDPGAADKLFASLRMSVPISICYCVLAWTMIGSWQAVAYLFTGLVVGYFSYEWLHYQAHHGAPRLRLFRYLRKYHLLHHHQTPDQRFGVTSPVVDYLFGTFRPVGGRAPRTKERTP